MDAIYSLCIETEGITSLYECLEATLDAFPLSWLQKNFTGLGTLQVKWFYQLRVGLVVLLLNHKMSDLMIEFQIGRIDKNFLKDSSSTTN